MTPAGRARLEGLAASRSGDEHLDDMNRKVVKRMLGEEDS